MRTALAGIVVATLVLLGGSLLGSTPSHPPVMHTNEARCGDCA